MKKSLILIFLFLISMKILHGQIIVNPYIVLIDDKNKFGTYSVMNETSDIQEVFINFKFEYIVSDENGNIRYDTVSAGRNDLTKWIKAYPKKIILNPKQKQIIRMTVTPPDNIGKGTYWTKIITSSQKISKTTDTTGKISARINFVFNQITTVIYKKGRYENNVEFKNLNVTTDTSGVHLIPSFSVTGDQPFYGHLNSKILTSQEELIIESDEYIAMFFDMSKRVSFPNLILKPGNYIAEITLSSEISSDVPKTDKGEILPITKRIDFIVQ